MNIAFALDFIPRRMQELGFATNYTTRYKHFRITRFTTMNFRAYNEFMYLITPEENIRIVSTRGIYDAEDTTINFQQHEHSGKVSIRNKSTSDLLVLLIQVIPLNKKNKDSHA